MPRQTNFTSKSARPPATYSQAATAPSPEPGTRGLTGLGALALVLGARPRRPT